MTHLQWRFAQCREDKALPGFLNYHSKLHQQALYSNLLNKLNVMKVSTKLPTQFNPSRKINCGFWICVWLIQDEGAKFRVVRQRASWILLNENWSTLLKVAASTKLQHHYLQNFQMFSELEAGSILHTTQMSVVKPKKTKKCGPWFKETDNLMYITFNPFKFRE